MFKRMWAFLFMLMTLSGCSLPVASEWGVGAYSEWGVGAYDETELRKVRVELLADSESIIFSWSNYKERADLPINKQISEALPAGSYIGDLLVPKNQHITVFTRFSDSVSPYEKASMKIKVSGVQQLEPNDNTLKVSASLIDLNPIIKDELKELSKEQISDLFEITEKFNKISSSPKYLAPSLLSEAKFERTKFEKKYPAIMRLETGSFLSSLGRGLTYIDSKSSYQQKMVLDDLARIKYFYNTVRLAYLYN